MEGKTHYGTTLLVGSLVILWLDFLFGLLATGIMLIVAQLPDKDQYIRGVNHRGPTHSLIFSIWITLLLASLVAFSAQLVQRVATTMNIASSMLVSPYRIWIFISTWVFLSLLVHLGTDMLTEGGGYKVKLFWPFNSWTYAYKLCKSDNEYWNGVLQATGVSVFMCVILYEIHHLIF